MKKIISISLVAALVLGLGSCKKSPSTVSGTNHLGQSTTPVVTTPPVVTNPLGDIPVGQIPTDFTKKAVIEESTAAWCGYCPNGAYFLLKAVADYPDKVYGIAYHNTDIMSDAYDANTTASESELSSTFSISGIPAGFVNRKSTTNNYNSWGTDCAAELAKVATCGLGIITKKVDASNYTIEVHTGFNTSVSGDYRVVTYIVENDLHKGAQYDQHNYMDADAGSPWFGKGNPMPASNYKHQHVLRQCMTSGIWGDAIDASGLKAKGEFIKTYNLEINSLWDVNNLEVISMIVKKGADVSKHTIENAQQVKLGDTKKWD